MGILERTRHVVRADLNALLKKAKNPSIVLDAYLDDLEAVLAEAMSIRAAEEAEREMYAARLRDLKATQQSWQAKAMHCLRRGDEELARSALEKKLDMQQEIDGLEQEIVQHQENLDILEGSVEALRTRMQEVLRTRRQLRFRHQLLQARSELQGAIGRLGAEEDEPMFDGAAEELASLESRLEAEEDMHQGGLDERVLRLEAAERRKRKSAAIERELELMRRSIKRTKN